MRERERRTPPLRSPHPPRAGVPGLSEDTLESLYMLWHSPRLLALVLLEMVPPQPAHAHAHPHPHAHSHPHPHAHTPSHTLTHADTRLRAGRDSRLQPAGNDGCVCERETDRARERDSARASPFPPPS